ncbi:hypothetical protein [Planktotalea sp.]|uniref:hypothetical protein n=1 Tax=Planktotalea sp. TaxID=2029877 RepID=UPI0025F6F41F|nr:hypothetical protein [Planktotalea sp.]
MDDRHTVIFEDSFEHMGSAIHRMNYYTPQTCLKTRAIAPPKERDWLRPSLTDLIDAIEADVFPPC